MSKSIINGPLGPWSSLEEIHAPSLDKEENPYPVERKSDTPASDALANPDRRGPRRQAYLADDGVSYDDFDNSTQNPASHPPPQQNLTDPDPEDFESLRLIWANRAEEMADWAWMHLVNRTDVWGQYKSLDRRCIDGRNKASTMPSKEDRGTIILGKDQLIAHFKSSGVGDIIGLHAIGLDNTCRWLAFDIDCHDEEIDSEKNTENELQAIKIYDDLAALGLHPLLTESNGNGGYHIHVVLNAPTSSEVVFTFAQQIASRVSGNKPETFPKQKQLGEGKFGSYLRLFGRHHTREHFTTVYDDGFWYSGNEAIDRIVAVEGDDPNILSDFLSRAQEECVVENVDVSTERSAIGGWLADIVALIPGPHLDDYDDWFRIGMAIHREMPNEEGLAIWDDASKRSNRYEDGACAIRWDGFSDEHDDPVTLGTLIQWIRAEQPEYSPPRKPSAEEVDNSHGFEVLTWRELRRQNPNSQYPPAVIEGLLREREVMNLVSGPKIGKSWATMQLGLAVAAGMPWLGFATQKGKVLLIDGELDKKTITARLDSVAAAMGVEFDSAADDVTVISLRGKRTDLTEIEKFCRSIPPGTYRLILLDPLYLLFPPGKSEANDHDVRDLYLGIISIAEETNTPVVVVHHTTKGNQNGKGITDIGSGHGVQSRIVDTHAALLPMQTQEGSTEIVKFEAVTRTFRQPGVKYLQRASDDVPIWRLADNVIETERQSEGGDLMAAQQFAIICARPEEEKKALILGRGNQILYRDKPLTVRRAGYLFEQALRAGYIQHGSRKTLYYRNPTREEELRAASQQQLAEASADTNIEEASDPESAAA